MKDRILHGLYAIEANIPSEPELEKEFNVSKITIRNAIKELVQEGYLEKRSGKGTKVIRNTSTAKVSKGKRFTEVLVEEGYKVQKRLIEMKIVNNQPGTEPFRLFGEACLRIERIYYLDKEPYIHYMHYLPKYIGDSDLENLSDQSLYQFIEEQNISLESFRDEFAVVTVPSSIAEYLGVGQGMALLKRIRFAYDGSDQIIEYSEGHYHTAMQNYIVNYDV